MNESPKKWKLILIGLMAGMLLGGTIAVTTPSVAAGPAKIWKQIKKKADKRYYTKTKSNNRFAPKPQVIRGVLSLGSSPLGGFSITHVSFGANLTVAPVIHLIAPGGAPPSGCSGTVAVPNASQGHLCIFERIAAGFNPRFVCAADNDCSLTASKFGFFYGAISTTNQSVMDGSWAVGVGAISSARMAPVKTTGKVTRGPTGQ